MILVTGATGHGGRAVVCRLASLGHDMVAMVRDVRTASRRLPSGIADYQDASALKRALAGNVASAVPAIAGFEGVLNEQHQRSRISGWRFRRLLVGAVLIKLSLRLI
jgi:uncharacterized protein YbjT (DUF2867 family)